MTDNLKESLSALIDGEASEIEVHRLLRQIDTDKSLKPSWVRYLQVRAVVRGENVLTEARHLELHARISSAVENEGAHSSETGNASARRPGNRRFVMPAAGLAVAASLVVAVFVGMNIRNTDEPAAVAATPAADPITVQTVANGVPEAFDGAPFEDGELRELDVEKQRMIRAYLNQHDRMVRMNPNVRTVNFEPKEEK